MNPKNASKKMLPIAVVAVVLLIIGGIYFAYAMLAGGGQDSVSSPQGGSSVAPGTATREPDYTFKEEVATYEEISGIQDESLVDDATVEEVRAKLEAAYDKLAKEQPADADEPIGFDIAMKSCLEAEENKSERICIMEMFYLLKPYIDAEIEGKK